MKISIALAGNPNSGKTTLFNALTGSNQYVGNWPGVTVERKEALFELGEDQATLTDLPGVYSLSPYSIEENITRNFIAQPRPDVVLNIVNAPNLGRLSAKSKVMKPARVGIAARYLSGSTSAPFRLGLHGPMAFNNGIWPFVPVTAVLGGRRPGPEGRPRRRRAEGQWVALPVDGGGEDGVFELVGAGG